MPITDTFDGSAGTDISTHDSNWTDHTLIDLDHSELDGSGELRLSNLFQTNAGYYDDAGLDEDSDSTVIFAGSLTTTGLAAADTGPVIRMTTTQGGYSCRIQALSGNNISTIRFLEYVADTPSSIQTISAVNTYDVTSATSIEMTLSINGAGTVLSLFLEQGATSETIVTTNTLAGLSGGKPGFILSPNNNSSVQFAEWSTTGGGGSTSDVNYTGANRGIMRGVARGVG